MFPLENIILSARNRMRIIVHRVGLRMNIASADDTFVTPFILVPKIFKQKNVFERTLGIFCTEKRGE